MTLRKQTITIYYDDVQGEPAGIIADDACLHDGVEAVHLGTDEAVTGATYDENLGKWDFNAGNGG